jgi:hypothetical protein
MVKKYSKFYKYLNKTQCNTNAKKGCKEISGNHRYLLKKKETTLFTRELPIEKTRFFFLRRKTNLH